MYFQDYSESICKYTGLRNFVSNSTPAGSVLTSGSGNNITGLQIHINKVEEKSVRTMAGDLGTQLVMGEDNLSWKYYGSVGREWSTSLAALA